MGVERRGDHAEFPSDILDPHRLVEALAESPYGAGHSVGVPTESREVTHATGLRPRQKQVDDLADDERCKHPILTRRVDEPHKAKRGVEQARVERANVRRLHATVTARMNEA